MNDLKFLKGLAEEYTALDPKVETTFYYTTDDGKLYLGTHELTTEADVKAAVAKVATHDTDIQKLKTEISTLIGSEDGQSIHDMIEKAVQDENTNYVGDKTTLATDDKTTIVAAINEIDTNADAAKAAADKAKTDSVVTIEKADGEADVATKYTIKQGGIAIAQTIDIPKDMVVSSGEVVVVTAEDIAEDGKYHGKVDKAGTYIKLVLSDDAKTELFILVDTLVDIYKAATDEEKTKEIKINVDNTTREISATLADGGVTSEKLANNAVTEGKIAENAVKSTNIADGAIKEGKLAENAVAEGNIKDGSIAIAKLNEELQNKITNTTEATIDDEEKTAGVWNDETGGQLFFLNKSSNVRANVSVNNGTDETGVYVQLSATDKDSNQGSRIDLDEHKAYYTTDKTSTEHTDKDEIAVKGDFDAYTKTSELGDLATKNESELSLEEYAKKADIKEGKTNGTIAVGETDINVHGLKSLAYKDEDELALTDYAKKTDITTGTTNGAIDVAGQSVAVYGLSELINAGVEQAKAYTDEKLTWGTIEAE